MRNRRVLIGLVAALLSFPVIAQNSAKNIKKQAVTENADTLSGIWSQNWILKLKPYNDGYRLDTVSVLYEKYFGVLNYLNDPLLIIMLRWNVCRRSIGVFRNLIRYLP